MNFFEQRRKELGKTQRQIANELELTDAAIGAWERGVAHPKLRRAGDLARAYEVSVDRIVKELSQLQPALQD